MLTLATRAATAADYAVFVRLFAELGVPDPVPDPARFASWIAPRAIMCEEHGAVVGYATWRAYGATAHVVQVAVAPEARGRGVGRTLMEAIRAAVIAAGCTRWYLNVKRDNTPALRLYARCGMEPELDSWALRIAWTDVDALGGEPASAFAAITPAAADDATLAAQLDLDAGRLANLRARPGTHLVALRDAARFVAFAAFDPAFPGAYPFCVQRRTLARPLLDACRHHADPRHGHVHVTIERDATAKDALVAAGAALVFELQRLGGAP